MGGDSSNPVVKDMFPFVSFPKVKVEDEPSLNSLEPKPDFLNAVICLNQNLNDDHLLNIEKVEFLMQSFVIQIDDEIIGWLLKFKHMLASNLQ